MTDHTGNLFIGDPHDEVSGFFHWRPCPLCGSQQWKTLIVSVDYNHRIPGEFRYVRCLGCALVFENPTPDPDSVMSLYPDDYGTPNDFICKGQLSGVDSDVNKMRAAVIHTQLDGGQLLDIGCGVGLFLTHMVRNGWQVAGMDPSPEHVEIANRRMGLSRVICGQWPTDRIADGPFDIVTMFHVIEHLYQPLAGIRGIKDVLSPGGLVVIETPNIESWPARLYGKRWVTLDAPRHLVLFSKHTLKLCIRMAGFDVLSIETVSPSVMEYTESLRYAINDLGLRTYRKTSNGDHVHARSMDENLTRSAFSLKTWFKRAERRLYGIANHVADRQGQGCNLLAVARVK